MLMVNALTVLAAIYAIGVEAAPVGIVCHGDIRCMYNNLVKRVKKEEKPTPTLEPPCKRMLTRHGKRSVCTEENTQSPQRISLERRVNEILNRRRLDSVRKEPQREIVLPEKYSQLGYREVKDGKDPLGSSKPKQSDIQSLSSQLDRLKERIANFKKTKEDSSRSETKSDNKAMPQESFNTLSKKLEKIRDDINNIVPLLSTKGPSTSLPRMQQLQVLSRQLAKLDQQKKLAKTTTELAPESKKVGDDIIPSIGASDKKLSTTVPPQLHTSDKTFIPPTRKMPDDKDAKIAELTKTVNDLIAVDKLAYKNLEKRIDALQQSQG